MIASITLAITLNEVILALLLNEVSCAVLDISREFRYHPQLSKCVHHVPPNQ
ncbi:hypothetical protein NBRC3293_1061 [Gluconobacter oxydans NBRC 3293]|uniref:Uncharacterized protein n=1 Tax=Gluconobacter oxydans NBRC 3293 TaxID=1315969 RepID=A0A829WTW0_GLUOY|nr:hypothetical protein NBRC3293_1061 [Gluconobacter oxydans NBRC 3293]